MADQPIKSSELIQDGFLNEALKQADLFLHKAAEIETQLKSTLNVSKEFLSSAKVNSSKELEAQAKATKEATNNLVALEKVQQEASKVEKAKIQLLQEAEKLEQQRIKTAKAAAAAEQQYNKEIEKTTRAQKNSNSEYSQASTALLNLSKRVKDNVVAGRELSKTARLVADAHKELKTKVDLADHSVSDFRRNVGNYPKELKAIQRELAGLEPGTKQFDELAKKAGVLKDKIGDAKDAIKAYSAESKAGQAKTLFGQTLDSIKNLDFKDASDKAKQFGEIVKSITFAEVIGGIKDLGSALLSVGKALLLNPLTYIAAALAAGIYIVYDYIKAFQRFGEITEDVNAQLKKTTDFVNDLRNKQEEYLLRISLAYSKFNDEQKKQKLNDLKNNQERKAILKEFGEETLKLIKTRAENEKGFAKIDAARKVLEEINYYKNLAALEKTFGERLRELRKTQNLEDAADNAETKAEKIKAAIQSNKDLQDELEKIRASNTLIDEQRLITEAKLSYAADVERVKSAVGGEKVKYQLLVELETELQQKIAKIRGDAAEERRLKLEKETKELQDKALKDEADFQAKLKIVEVTSPQIEANNKELAARKEKKEKELKDAAKFSGQLVDIVAKEEAEKSRLRLEAIDKDIKDKEDAIDIQRNLAQRGQANTLAFEEEQKRKLELQKEEEKKQEIKRQKVLAFFKLFASYAEKDPDKALQNALRDTILAEAVSGAFFKGTEKVEDDLQGNKVHNNRDGYQIRVDGKERILTGDQNKLVGNMSNEQLAQLAYDSRNGILAGAKYNIMPTNDFAANIESSVLLHNVVKLNDNIETLINVTKNKPVSNFQFDGWDMLQETITNGITKRTRYKQPKPRI